ncbi:hypothetical protein [Mangrovihabitans endophyticus]
MAGAGCASHDPVEVGDFVAAPASGAASVAPATVGATATASVAASPAPSRSARGTPATSAPPVPGDADGGAGVPSQAKAEDTSDPDHVVGTGTAASCTSAAVVEAVAAGGVITFDCGPRPVTIRMAATVKIKNGNGPRIVLDGGGTVTLDGGGKRRILYMNTCDPAQGWTTAHCQDQDHPRLTVQNITFAHGDSTGETAEGGGGGAIFARGGRIKIINSRFTGNRCDRTGPDLGGGAVRVLSQSRGLPVYVVRSTFTGGRCSNGGALSSIGVSWTVLNSVFRDNRAIGTGANPARGGTPGGGSGGAIYLDGNRFALTLDGTTIEDNRAKEGGGAVFFVSNDRTGTMALRRSVLRHNPSQGFETPGLPGIFFLGARDPSTSGSTLRK